MVGGLQDPVLAKPGHQPRDAVRAVLRLLPASNCLLQERPVGLHAHDRHRHCLDLAWVDAVGVRHVDSPERVHRLPEHRLSHHVELAGVLHPAHLVPDAVGIVPIPPQFDLGGAPAPFVLVVELVDVHKTTVVLSPGIGLVGRPNRFPEASLPQTICRWEGWIENFQKVGGVGGAAQRTMTPMNDLAHRPIDRMASEWEAIGRSEDSRLALQLLAASEPAIASAGVSDLGQLVDSLRCSGSGPESVRADAAFVIRAMLRSEAVHPMIGRAILQALVPGLVTVARRLSWGAGGEWEGPAWFFSDAVATAWEVISEWQGQDRRYAVLDLLSAVRCRLRRQLLRHRQRGDQAVGGLDVDVFARPTWSSGTTDLDELVRAIDELDGRGIDPGDAALLYANRVLGMSVSELSRLTGRSRRHVAGGRDRAAQEIARECA